MKIRLMRAVDAPDGHGPRNGMWALQRALSRVKPPWLEIGGDLQYGEIPWFWCWADGIYIEHFATRRWPFVVGPCVLFNNPDSPGERAYERAVLDTPSCLCHFTETPWYADLITAHCTANKAPIVLWPFPIEPMPLGPTDTQWDILLYVKHRSLLSHLPSNDWFNSRVKTIFYGEYKREELSDAARRSKCCLYLSESDRGPLALEEILLSGCPSVGLPRGAPWIEDGKSGFLIRNWGEAQRVLQHAQWLDRNRVREWALRRFDTKTTVNTILEALVSALGRYSPPKN